MMQPFSFKDKLAAKERFSVGLDIGSSAIKTVRLKIAKDSAELIDFAAESATVDLAAALKTIRILQEARAVNISFSGPSTILRYVSFPQMSREELGKALKFEAQKYIPFSVNELNLDSYILKEGLPDNKMLVLLAGAKKELTDQRLKVLNDAGLRPGIIDIDSIAVTNAFTYNYPEINNTVALLNIGALFSNLTILEEGLPRLSRDIQFGGNNITEKLSEAFGLEFASGEALKFKPEQGKIEKMAAIEVQAVTTLAAELRTSFDYYESQSSSSVTKIFLSGGSSLGTGLKDTLANLIGIEVECWSPVNKIGLASGISRDKLDPVLGQMGVAVGLALR